MSKLVITMRMTVVAMDDAAESMACIGFLLMVRSKTQLARRPARHEREALFDMHVAAVAEEGVSGHDWRVV